jgi:hypothetical protein
VSFLTVATIYLVGWLSGICSVLFYDLMQHLKGN